VDAVAGGGRTGTGADRQRGAPVARQTVLEVHQHRRQLVGGDQRTSVADGSAGLDEPRNAVRRRGRAGDHDLIDRTRIQVTDVALATTTSQRQSTNQTFFDNDPSNQSVQTDHQNRRRWSLVV